jgi:16S rRNA (cytosine967-C5)-methyltransferase
MKSSRARAARAPRQQHDLPTARKLACEILAAAEKEELYLDQILEKRLAHTSLPAADRALVTALANGVMRARARLDAEIIQYFRKNYKTAPPLFKNILRTALFQMRFMDRIPAYAAIHEAVALARAKFGENLARLCNAVLRSAQRAPHVWPAVETMLAQNEIADLSDYLSYPPWLVARWLAQNGAGETLALAQACNEIPDIYLRIVRPAQNAETVLDELRREHISYAPVPEVPDTYKLSHADQIAALSSFRNGACTVQDASTCLVAGLAAPQAGDTILDLCAAPGGKSLHLAELAAPGKVIAVDIRAQRLRLLVSSAQRLKLSVHTIVSDARYFAMAPVDLVLVDAPCSGLGVLGRRSDLRWRRKPEDIPKLAQLQKEILANAAELVKTGGRLIYGTCTITPEENDEIMAWFQQQYPAFILQPAWDFLPAPFCDEKGFVRTWPHRHRMDGSFAARFVKAS